MLRLQKIAEVIIDMTMKRLLLLSLWSYRVRKIVFLSHDRIISISNEKSFTIQFRKTSFYEDSTEHHKQTMLCRYSDRDYDGNEMGKGRYNQIYDQRQRSCNTRQTRIATEEVSYQKRK